jgi:hypothetical protein
MPIVIEYEGKEMELDETTLVSGRILAEFEDDASQFLSGISDYVRAPETTAVMPALSLVPTANGLVQEKPG